MLVQGELLKAQLENAAAAPLAGAKSGLIYMDTGLKVPRVHDGTLMKSILLETMTVKAVVANYTLLATDQFVQVTPASNTTITVPNQAANMAGKLYTFHRVNDLTDFAVDIDFADNTVSPKGAENSSYALFPGATLTIMWVSSSVEWVIISETKRALQQHANRSGTHNNPLQITAGGGIPINPGPARQIVYIEGSGGSVDITNNPQIVTTPGAPGDGDELILHGTDTTNTVIVDNIGIRMGAASRTLNDNSTLILVFDREINAFQEVSFTAGS